MENYSPILTLLIPSRKRFNDLVECIDSFIKTANDKRNLEVIIKFDTDDIFSWSRIGELRNDYKIKILVTDRLDGYRSLHTFANYMYPHATGKWIMFSNDDIKMMTNDWDLILKQEPDSYKCLNPFLYSQSITPTMPIIGKSACDLFGCFSKNHAIDRYIQDIYSRANMTKNIPLTFNHLMLNDDLVKDRRDGDVKDDWEESEFFRDMCVKKLVNETTFIDGDNLNMRIL